MAEQGGAITAEEAAAAFAEIGLNEQQILAVVQIVINMSAEAIDQLLGAMSGGGGQPQEQAPQEETY